MCVGTFSLEQEKDLERHCNLLQRVGNFGFKQDHNATWRQVWNNKTCYKNEKKLGNFSSDFYFIFFGFFFHVCVFLAIFSFYYECFVQFSFSISFNLCVFLMFVCYFFLT
jgi:hypothetical protein